MTLLLVLVMLVEFDAASWPPVMRLPLPSPSPCVQTASGAWAGPRAGRASDEDADENGEGGEAAWTCRSCWWLSVTVEEDDTGSDDVSCSECWKGPAVSAEGSWWR